MLAQARDTMEIPEIIPESKEIIPVKVIKSDSEFFQEFAVENAKDLLESKQDKRFLKKKEYATILYSNIFNVTFAKEEIYVISIYGSFLISKDQIYVSYNPSVAVLKEVTFKPEKDKVSFYNYIFKAMLSKDYLVDKYNIHNWINGLLAYVK